MTEKKGKANKPKGGEGKRRKDLREIERDVFRKQREDNPNELVGSMA